MNEALARGGSLSLSLSPPSAGQASQVPVEHWHDLVGYPTSCDEILEGMCSDAGERDRAPGDRTAARFVVPAGALAHPPSSVGTRSAVKLSSE